MRSFGNWEGWRGIDGDLLQFLILCSFFGTFFDPRAEIDLSGRSSESSVEIGLASVLAGSRSVLFM